ncbi:Lrp/AsnC family transcriptional regulator [Salinilacihabitans rarus]|uniref:siroheme decarboxylase subunit beta n=1 Tax=Salinilacihabitans rarus TaxID=2961596 RepID=UPI0020C8B761|nr:Lrp/AsnC family transcriptional regulator [Salinilacihabitans rarus]
MSDDWREGLDAVDEALLDGYQRGFPVERRPFEAIGADLGIDGDEAFDRVRALVDRGAIRRVGPVLAPSAIGSSTLAALSVPDDEFAAAAAVVNGYPQVSHNYRRDHEWNMWFVLAAGSRARRDALLADIAAETGREPLVLPKLRTYGVDLAFAVGGDDRTPGESSAADERPRAGTPREEQSVSLTRFEGDLLLEIQDGLPPSATPYADVAASLGADVDDVLAALDRLLDRGAVKRVGCVVSHRKTGFDANCMVVWAVPEDAVDAVGREVAAYPFVTKCYRRPRRPDRGWEYTLFTMLHGRSRAAVDERIDDLAAEIQYPHERLSTVEKLKQTGVRFERLGEGR